MKKENIHQFYDKTYTKLFSHKRIVSDFVKGFVTEDFAKDIEILEKLDTKFITKKYKKYESDVIYKAKFKGKEVFVFILIEFQTKNDHLISLRLMNYLSLFYLNQVKEENITPPFPPVIPIVIHIGDDNFTKYRNFNQLINIPYKSLNKYIPNFKYFLLDLNTFPKRKFAELTVHSNNIASLLFEVDKYSENELSENFEKVITVIKENCSTEIQIDFQEYLIAIISDDKKEELEIVENLHKEPSMLYNTIQNMKERIRKEGKKEGKKEGRFQAEFGILSNIYQNNRDVDSISKLTGVPVKLIKEILNLK